MNLWKRQLWLVIGIIFVLILSACGSSSTSSAPSTSNGKASPEMPVPRVETAWPHHSRM